MCGARTAGPLTNPHSSLESSARSQPGGYGEEVGNYAAGIRETRETLFHPGLESLVRVERALDPSVLDYAS